MPVWVRPRFLGFNSSLQASKRPYHRSLFFFENASEAIASLRNTFAEVGWFCSSKYTVGFSTFRPTDREESPIQTDQNGAIVAVMGIALLAFA